MLPRELLERTWVNHSPTNQQENCLITAFYEFVLSGEISQTLHSLIGGELISKWNDCHTKEEVIAVARLAEMKLGLRAMETEGEERASAVVAHSRVT